MARPFKKWTKPLILRELKRLHKSHADLSYTALGRRKQSLLSAAAYHFGSYRSAVQHAGIEYDEVLRGRAGRGSQSSN